MGSRIQGFKGSRGQGAESWPANQFNQQTNSTNKPAVRATFFTLGWIARKCPALVREIHDRGHEVASHGLDHHLCNAQSVANLRKDLSDSKKLLEDIIGDRVSGYRAPSFSVNDGILKIIQDAGYRYDSSYNSFDRHGRYGRLSVDGLKRNGIAFEVADGFFELPVSNLTLKPMAYSLQPLVLPWGGGGYFRLMPYPLFRKGIRRILSSADAYSFYLHPWEVDPAQPRVKDAPAAFKFRHYINLASTYKKLRRMLTDFRDCRFGTCREYIEAVAKNRL